MIIEYLRGACVIIEMAGNRILCDPWLEDGIYHGAWAHFPRWTESDWQKHRPWDVDLIYISHIHPDHFDPLTMKELVRRGCKAPALIAKYDTTFLRKRIEACGVEVIELEAGRAFYPHAHRPAHIRIYQADHCNPNACGKLFSCLPLVRNTQVDSLAVFDDGDRTIVNVNDCPWGLADKVCHQIARDYPEIDYALIAYAGAGPFPQCFKGLSHGDKRAHADTKKRNFIKAVANFARALRAKRILPFAGDYQLCGPLSALNEYRGIPEFDEVHGELRGMGLSPNPLYPGDSTAIEIPYVRVPSPDERKAYVQSVLSTRELDYARYAPVPIEELVSLSVGAFERFDQKRREYGLQAKGTIYIKFADGIFLCIPPVGDSLEACITDKPDANNAIFIECDTRLLKMLLTGPKEAHWNNAEIGSHLTFERRGVYEAGVHHMMSFLHN